MRHTQFEQRHPCAPCGRGWRRWLLAAACLACLRPAAAAGENWPQWRGPRLDGVSHETGIATHWSRTENVAWRLPLPGPAGATPVVWGNRIFLTTVDGDQLDLLCVSTDGKLLWQRNIARGNKNVRGDEGNSASPSPSTDGQCVWTFMGTGDLACFQVDGKKVWQFNLQERYGRFQIQFGMTSTPVLDGDHLYLQLIHGDGDAATREAVVVCLDKRTGDQVWRHDRQSDARDECEHSYASPTIYRDSQRAFLVTHGANYVMGHSLKTGDELWRCGGLNPPSTYNPALRFIASPVAAEGLVVAPTAKGGPVVAIEATARGDVTGTEAVRWRMDRDTPDVPSPLIADGLVYLCRENGILICVDARTGKVVYYRRTLAQRHRASPILVDGNVYLTARNGTVTVIRAGRKFEIVSQNALDEPISSSPVVSDGVLYLRSFDALYAIRP